MNRAESAFACVIVVAVLCLLGMMFQCSYRNQDACMKLMADPTVPDTTKGQLGTCKIQ